ncbi:MAG TPA: pitrilysin family protein [Candidatus Dormibacteraeota bacterium]|nr:pitrilysin family protein [Candidatus Dormibacteraeota bacterium]
MQHEIKVHSLAGRAKLLVINMPNAATFYFGSYIRNGYRFCDPQIYDTPHLLEHLSFEGNKKYPNSIDFKSTIETLGSRYNAMTSPHMVKYFFNAGKEHVIPIINIALDQIFEPLIESSRVEQQKKVIAEELTRSLDNDRRNRAYRTRHAVFPAINPDFAERIKMVGSITADDVRSYFSKTHVVANTRFVLAGDFTANELGKIIESLNRRLSGYESGKELKYTPLKPGKYQGLIQAFPSSISSQHHFHLGFILPGYDPIALPPLKLLNTMLGLGMGSRVMVKAREKGLTYSLQAGLLIEFDCSDFWIADQTSPDKLEPLINLLSEELYDIAQGNYSQNELNRALGVVKGGLERRQQTPTDLADWYSSAFMFELGLDSPADRIKQLESVTKDDIQKAAAKYITSGSWTMTLIGAGLEKKAGHYQTLLKRYFS